MSRRSYIDTKNEVQQHFIAHGNSIKSSLHVMIKQCEYMLWLTDVIVKTSDLRMAILLAKHFDNMHDIVKKHAEIDWLLEKEE